MSGRVSVEHVGLQLFQSISSAEIVIVDSRSENESKNHNAENAVIQDTRMTVSRRTDFLNNSDLCKNKNDFCRARASEKYQLDQTGDRYHAEYGITLLSRKKNSA